MSPPPLTPTPRRFLLPSAKRSVSTGTQYQQTPASSSLPRGQQSQFHSTPKFAPTSTPWSARKATQDIEEVEDVPDEVDQIETTSSSPEGDEEHKAGDIIDEIEADRETESDDGSPRDTEHHHEGVVFMDKDESTTRDDSFVDSEAHHLLHSPNERLYKKRRVSLSPDIQSESLLSDYDHENMFQHDSGNAAEPVTHASTPHSEARTSPGRPDIISVYDSHDSDRLRTSSPIHARNSREPNQPTFYAAPRFRAPSPSSVPPDILPTAFSPQRRGQQFLAGGMAAALQKQLSEIKSWDGHSGSTPQTAASPGGGGAANNEWMLQVEEVRAGRRMYLIRGLGTAAKERQSDQRVILAGEGTLTGLGRRALLSVGDRVKVRQPVWEAVIEGETWLVACDWRVT